MTGLAGNSKATGSSFKKLVLGGTFEGMRGLQPQFTELPGGKANIPFEQNFLKEARRARKCSLVAMPHEDSAC